MKRFFDGFFALGCVVGIAVTVIALVWFDPSVWLSDNNVLMISAALGALIGGGLTLAAQLFAIADQQASIKDNRERELRSSFMALVVKMHRTTNNLLVIERHINESIEFARDNGFDLSHPASFIRPMAHPPPKTDIQADELLTLLTWGENDAYHEISDVAALHNTHLGVWELYGLLRAKSVEGIAPAKMDGQFGSYELSAEEFARIAPIHAEVDGLLAQILETYNKDAERAKAALDDLARIANERTGSDLTFSDPMEKHQT